MANSRKYEQHIAMFGESGSGKTVLVSSFYGATQEPSFIHHSLFDVVADDMSQGNHLRKNYLGMRNSSVLPMPTRFDAKRYSFLIKLKADEAANKKHNSSNNGLRIIWHDYPGEWFEDNTGSAEEERRKIDTFKNLLGSDVAVVMVDAQRLIDNAGTEESYLKYLFGNFRSMLLTMRDRILSNEAKLATFPRIWIIALSKADLLPQMNVHQFKDLIIEKATDEVDDLRETLASFIQAPEALSFGEDFLLLSSAKFEPDKILVDQRVGVNLMLPVAAVLPFERFAKWAGAKEIPLKVVESLMPAIQSIGGTLFDLPKRMKKMPLIIKIIVEQFPRRTFTDAAARLQTQLHKINADAHNKHETMREIISDFAIKLDEAEKDEILARSKR
jgi:GTPase SAR1 family protein